MPGGSGHGAGGKLKALARAWATGKGGGAQADPDNPHAAAIEAHLASRKRGGSGEIEICPDEKDAAVLFLALGTQWRWHPMAGVRLGIEYASIAPTAAACEIAMTPALFVDLRQMEAAAIEVQR